MCWHRIGIDKGTLVIKCKDLRQFNITIPGVDEASNVAYTIEVGISVMFFLNDLY